jgi:hypothetical protein
VILVICGTCSTFPHEWFSMSGLPLTVSTLLVANGVALLIDSGE